MKISGVLAVAAMASVAGASAGTKEEYRDLVRGKIMRSAGGARSGPLGNDQASDLVDKLVFTRLAEMEGAGLLKAELATVPWSDSYWPIYAGITAARYSDPEHSMSYDWKENADYLLGHLGAAPEIRHLSPAEKYDLLVGDPGFTLTRQQLSEGAWYYEETGEVEGWMGICHGWAPASFTLERPRRAVTALAADGETEILFYPADIKALATLLWANGDYGTRFVGGRCEQASPVVDENGRPVQAECLDTNPATWHLAVVNQLGVARRGMIMDAALAYQVWNQPLFAYEYGYFNPQTGQDSATLEGARVELADYPGDPYAATRSPGTRFLAGVRMEVRYGSENHPSPDLTDGPENDNYGAALLEYDLELDGSGRIVGGEWRESSHPDFLWTPARGARARSVADRILDNAGDSALWKPARALPATWRKAAVRGSQEGQPLARIVDALIRQAQ
jgi:hypothetical protein